MMFKKSSLAFGQKKRIHLFVLFFLLPSLVFASGKALVSPGEQLNISAQTGMTNPQYEWTVLHKGEVIHTLSTPSFSFSFLESGEYRINVIIKNAQGKQEETHASILAGDDLRVFQPLAAIFDSIPPQKEGYALVVTDPAQALVSANRSTGNIVEYHIDQNIEQDSDNDGDPQNDIDNKNHPSFSDGSLFPLIFSQKENPITAKLTVIGKEGERKSENILFHFGEKKRGIPLKAVLSSIPPANSRGEIHLSKNTTNVVFYAAGSEGDVVQYHFDKNIEVDSNQDGEKNNDIDNKDHPSFLTGEPLSFSFDQKDGKEQTMQLTAVSPDRKGSRIKRRIIFDAPLILKTEEKIIKEDIHPELLVGTKEAFVGDKIPLSVFGAPESAQYKWDINGDGTMDQEGKNSSIQALFEKKGEYTPAVHILWDDQKIVLTETISVRKNENREEESLPPVADFSVQQEGNKITLTNTSTTDSRLSHGDFVSDWDFGDGSSSTEKSPVYLYRKAGEYKITLSITDSVGKNARKTESIIITEITLDPEGNNSDEIAVSGGGTDGEQPGEDNQNTENPPTAEDPDEKGDPEEPSEKKEDPSFSFPWGKILLFLLFLVPIVIIAMLVIRKVQNPDLSFRELAEEEAEKWLGSGKTFEHLSNTPTKETPLPVKKEEKPEDVVVTEEEKEEEIIISPPQEEEKEEETPAWLRPKEEEVETPDWLQNATTNEEIPKPEEAPSNIQENKEEDSSPKQEENIPDWLKPDTPSEEKNISPEEKKEEDIFPSEKEKDSNTSSQEESSDIPDWLQGEKKEIPKEKTEVEVNIPEKIETPLSQEEVPEEEEKFPDTFFEDNQQETVNTILTSPQKEEGSEVKISAKEQEDMSPSQKEEISPETMENAPSLEPETEEETEASKMLSFSQEENKEMIDDILATNSTEEVSQKEEAPKEKEESSLDEKKDSETVPEWLQNTPDQKDTSQKDGEDILEEKRKEEGKAEILPNWLQEESSPETGEGKEKNVPSLEKKESKVPLSEGFSEGEVTFDHENTEKKPQ